MNKTKLKVQLKELQEQQAKVQEQLDAIPEVIEPVGGDFIVAETGYVEDLLGNSSDAVRLTCKTFTTLEEAKRARKEDYARDRVRERRDQLLRGGVGVGKEFNWEICSSDEGGWTLIYANHSIGALLMSRSVAKKICEELNSGALSLELPEHMQ